MQNKNSQDLTKLANNMESIVEIVRVCIMEDLLDTDEMEVLVQNLQVVQDAVETNPPSQEKIDAALEAQDAILNWGNAIIG